MISSFQVLRQVRAAVIGLEPATEGSLPISRQIRYPLYHRYPMQQGNKYLHERITLDENGKEEKLSYLPEVIRAVKAGQVNDSEHSKHTVYQD
ncbi:hypothetical protein PoB_001012800 [Plakobranchus ocellatus]|uniref:Uncharacterized protein n=1 Tax=Plakobranchus ocellatus TaxID=259542 RepID=A0AAV3YMP6_9GAST|nr:hypothetical protein PoB_001012800 [Plakobranchus ocellatus]